MANKTVQELNKESFKALKEKLGLKNPMQAPKLLKVVVGTGFGSVKDKKKIELIEDRISRITGQKPALRKAKKAIATFKTRVGDPLAYQVTLRGPRMTEFMDRLINIALPRTKDFRGLPRTAVDAMGNYTGTSGTSTMNGRTGSAGNVGGVYITDNCGSISLAAAAWTMLSLSGRTE